MKRPNSVKILHSAHFGTRQNSPYMIQHLIRQSFFPKTAQTMDFCKVESSETSYSVQAACHKRPVLAIDADINQHLGVALGLSEKACRQFSSASCILCVP